MVEIRKVECPSDKVKIKCPYAMTPTRIVIHNTANDASAANEIAYMLSNNKETSFHFAVDDKEIVQG
ncbi:MAG: N-acetylmuramoyl-L-alanine amidase, partial [Acutalibacteraceae bacterium]